MTSFIDFNQLSFPDKLSLKNLVIAFWDWKLFLPSVINNCNNRIENQSLIELRVHLVINCMFEV